MCYYAQARILFSLTTLIENPHLQNLEGGGFQ